MTKIANALRWLADRLDRRRRHREWQGDFRGTTLNL